MHVLVTGATGFVGGRLVPALLEAGHDVRALVRDADRYEPPTIDPGGDSGDPDADDAGPDADDAEPDADSDHDTSAVEADASAVEADASAVDVVEGDLLQPETLDGVFEGIEASYYLVHSMGSGDDFEERDRRAARNFASAASDGGVDRVIYLGGLGEEGDDLSAHLRSRREVESILDDGEYDLTTLRAAVIVGPGSASFRMVVQLVKRLPLMVTPRWVGNECQPIAIDDVITYLVGVLDAPETADSTYGVGGPDVLTYGEMLQETARAMGRRPPTILPVPVLTPKLSAYWVGLVTDVDWQVARPLILGLKNPVVVTDDAIRDHLDVDLTPFDQAVEQALDTRQSGGDDLRSSGDGDR